MKIQVKRTKKQIENNSGEIKLQITTGKAMALLNSLKMNKSSILSQELANALENELRTNWQDVYARVIMCS